MQMNRYLLPLAPSIWLELHSPPLAPLGLHERGRQALRPMKGSPTPSPPPTSDRPYAYVRNRDLGIPRAKSAYNFFLASLKGKTVGMRRRLMTKSTVWRRDLLAMKFASLSPELRAVFEAKAHGAKDLVMTARHRELALRSGSSGVQGRGSSMATPANAGSPAALGTSTIVERPATIVTPTDVGGRGPTKRQISTPTRCQR